MSRALRSLSWQAPLRASLSVLVLLCCAAIHARAAEPKPVNIGLDAGLGSQGKATLLGIEGKGSKFVYVFDRSGSMGVPHNKPLDRAKAELLRSIDALAELQQFYIIFYNQDQKMFQIDPSGKRIIWANEQNKKAAKSWVGGITAGGATRHADALKMALRLHPDAIFLLTDGDPPDDITAEELSQLERQSDGATVINVIQISPPDADHDNLLIKLAKHSGGEHVYVDFNKAEAVEK